ncbi:hypothetical protein RND71_003773 [Anisodus tanguticus]|uniref:Uncharacterized protein n=1 Tax=Anisodus tanguticus TaxID=243964 RepID=A0AAE1SYG3_9SOLA|nr:hypothetical protein RND71_003773 [Anisodus tanguticus]
MGRHDAKQQSRPMGAVLARRIPKALGKLTQLGSLDLSLNHLSGRIPDELACLTFLSFLNLSFNKLSGRIPSGNQLRTFSSDYFEGNIRLCDFPLKKLCSDTKATGLSQLPNSHSEHDEVDGEYISLALGSSVCFGIVTWLLLYNPRYNELVDRLLFRRSRFGKINVVLDVNIGNQPVQDKRRQIFSLLISFHITGSYLQFARLIRSLDQESN